MYVQSGFNSLQVIYKLHLKKMGNGNKGRFNSLQVIYKPILPIAKEIEQECFNSLQVIYKQEIWWDMELNISEFQFLIGNL